MTTSTKATMENAEALLLVAYHARGEGNKELAELLENESRAIISMLMRG